MRQRLGPVQRLGETIAVSGWTLCAPAASRTNVIDGQATAAASGTAARIREIARRPASRDHRRTSKMTQIEQRLNYFESVIRRNKVSKQVNLNRFSKLRQQPPFRRRVADFRCA